MGRIRVLDEHLTNMIAAGEVVERPMGVVKELVENSIDAGSSRITVKVVNGGNDSIEVTDDGTGMDQQDAVMAFSRHATSKIRKTDDLWDIHTMGFRGEALPSIASVAKVELLTSDGNESTGIKIEYGKIVEAGPAARGQGTTIKVEGLFYKTPARLKHLKSGNVEFNYILEIMQKFAMSHPEIAFELISDGKTRLKTPGNGSLEEVLMYVYGMEVARNCLEADFGDYDFKVNGLLVLPSITRSTKQYINCFINGRIVRSYLIQKAVIDAYREFMMPDRYPIVAINMEVDYHLVDVNVHPSKWEIRLSKERQLSALIQKEVNEILKNHFKPGEINMVRPEKVKTEEKTLFTAAYSYRDASSDRPLYVEAETEKTPLILKETTVEVERFSYLCQLHGNYILACDDENLYIVDQHAAMERCMYEQILREMENNAVHTQYLLVPIMVELTPAQLGEIDKLNAVFNLIGIELEPFSNQSAIIRQVPVWFDEVNETEFIKDLIDAVLEEKKMSEAAIRKDKIATLACHSSIRFNRHLDPLEARGLLSRLGKCIQPFNCPHGRPTMMVISEAQLEKEFKRV